MRHQGEAGSSTGAREAGQLSEASSLTQKQLDKIIVWHGLNLADVKLPDDEERAEFPLPWIHGI